MLANTQLFPASFLMMVQSGDRPVAVSVSGMLNPRFWEALGARYGTATAVTVKNPVPSGSTMVAVHVIVVSVRPVL